MSTTVQASVLRRLIDTASTLGASSDELWESAGCSSAVNDSTRVPAPQLFALWSTAVRQTSYELSLELSRRLQLEHLGVFGFALMTARNCWQAFEVTSRLFPLVTDSGAWQPTPRDGELWVDWQRAPSRHRGQHLSTEASFAHYVACTRQVVGDPHARPLRIQLQHRAPRAAILALQQFVDCPIEIDAQADAIVWSRELCQAQPTMANAAMHTYFLAQGEQQLAQSLGDRTWHARVQRQLQAQLAEGVELDTVAAQLGVTGRTLRRRLAAEGRSFREVVDSTRRMHAQSLLREGRTGLTELAGELGFADQSSLSRAYRRWFGIAPRQARSGDSDW